MSSIPPLGFTLIELLVSMTVVALLMGMLLQTVFQTQNIWTQARVRVEEYREARTAFEVITRRLSQ
ncbi:MAG TPA: prepilin-type N-terminal cleavage/methylation domain-containing protein, partial [Verrucomicrobium sp.]|nr:prepilin-type N-terminal cleavage/methylation domain-containing protein [Verrucomicrobium sp.]